MIFAFLQQQAAPPQGPGGLLLFWWIFPLLIAFYLIFSIPQRKREKARREMLSRLKKNDRILTIGGIYGTVKSITDKEVVVQVDDSTKARIRFSRSAISQIISESDETAEKQK